MATYSRQFPGSLSVAKSTALRPQPSSTISHWGRSVLGPVIAAPLASLGPGYSSRWSGRDRKFTVFPFVAMPLPGESLLGAAGIRGACVAARTYGQERGEQ